MNVFELLNYQNAKTHGETEQHYLKTCIFSVINIVRYQKAKMHVKHLKWGKERHFEKRFCSVIMDVLGTETLEAIESTLYGKRIYYQKYISVQCFLSYLRTKTLKSRENSLYVENVQLYQKHVFP